MTRPAFLHLQGWHGRSKHPVEVVGETPKRYRVRATEKTRLPGRWLEPGQTALVPKYAVTFAPCPRCNGKGASWAPNGEGDSCSLCGE